MVNILWAAYLCKKNVWQNNERYQCRMKNNTIITTYKLKINNTQTIKPLFQVTAS